MFVSSCSSFHSSIQLSRMHTSGRSLLKLHLHVKVTEIIIRKDGEVVEGI